MMVLIDVILQGYEFIMNFLINYYLIDEINEIFQLDYKKFV